MSDTRWSNPSSTVKYWQVPTSALTSIFVNVKWRRNIFVNYFQICGMICTQSLYSTWKEEKLVIKSLEQLNSVRSCSGSSLPVWLNDLDKISPNFNKNSPKLSQTPQPPQNKMLLSHFLAICYFILQEKINPGLWKIARMAKFCPIWWYWPSPVHLGWFVQL